MNIPSLLLHLSELNVVDHITEMASDLFNVE